MRILLAVEPADFRCGIDGLASLCRIELKSEPLSGALFVFRNRRGTAIKILVYDGQGYWLATKRLSQGKFAWWPRDGQDGIRPLDAHELQVLLWNGNPDHTQAAPAWRRVAVGG
jgi:transposase